MGKDEEPFLSATDLTRPKRSTANSRFQTCCVCNTKKPTVVLRNTDDLRCDDCYQVNKKQLQAINQVRSRTYVPNSKEYVTSDISDEEVDKNDDASRINEGETPIESNEATQSLNTKRDSATQCNSGPIINEVLTYINNKCDLIPQFHLVKIIADFYTDNEIEAAKQVLYDSCPNHTGNRFKRRQGNDKTRKNIDDMVDMLTKCPIDQVPIFVARDLQNLLPIDITNIDVSNITAEVSNLKKARTEKKDSPMNEILHKLNDIKDEIRNESKKEINSLKEQMGVLQNMILADQSKSRDSSTTQFTPEDVSVPKQTRSYKDALSSESSRTAMRNVNSQINNQRPVKSVSFQGDERMNQRTYVEPSESDDGFTIVQRRRRSGGSNISVVTKRQWSIFISRVSPATTPDDIGFHVRSIEPDANVECIKLQTRFPTYNSFRVNIVSEDIERVMNTNNWPQGILIRKFFPPRRGTSVNRQNSIINQ